MSLADRDFVNGNLLQVPEFRLPIATLQVSFLQILDDVPANTQVTGHITNRHRLQKRQGVAFETTCIASPLGSEGDFDLAHNATATARHSGDLAPLTESIRRV